MARLKRAIFREVLSLLSRGRLSGRGLCGRGLCRRGSHCIGRRIDRVSRGCWCRGVGRRRFRRGRGRRDRFRFRCRRCRCVWSRSGWFSRGHGRFICDWRDVVGSWREDEICNDRKHENDRGDHHAAGAAAIFDAIDNAGVGRICGVASIGEGIGSRRRRWIRWIVWARIRYAGWVGHDKSSVWLDGSTTPQCRLSFTAM
jgi:hypothetical protein